MTHESARFAFNELPVEDRAESNLDDLKPLTAEEFKELKTLGGAKAAEREKNLAIFSPAIDDIRTLELPVRPRREIVGEVHKYKVKRKEKIETIDMKVSPMLDNIVAALKKERELIRNEVMEANKKLQELNEVKELLALIYDKRPEFIRGLRHADEVFKNIFTPQVLAKFKKRFESRYNQLHEDEKKYNLLSGRALSNKQ